MYINFCFRELEMDGDAVFGIFDAPDLDVNCRFQYNIATHVYHLWNSNKPEEEIVPIPFYWLDMKLEENGVLMKTERKISY